MVRKIKPLHKKSVDVKKRLKGASTVKNIYGLEPKDGFNSILNNNSIEWGNNKFRKRKKSKKVRKVVTI